MAFRYARGLPVQRLPGLFRRRIGEDNGLAESFSLERRINDPYGQPDAARHQRGLMQAGPDDQAENEGNRAAGFSHLQSGFADNS